MSNEVWANHTGNHNGSSHIVLRIHNCEELRR